MCYLYMMWRVGVALSCSVLQTDNSSCENDNRYVVAYCTFMHGVFQKVREIPMHGNEAGL